MVKLNNIDEYIAYFEDMARRNKQLLHSVSSKHFYAFDADELDTGFRGEIQYPALVLEYPESSFSGPSLSHIVEKLTGAFWVTTGSVSPNDTKAIKEALKKSKDIGYSIVSKMVQDFKDRRVMYFNTDQVKMNKIGPIMDDLYFYRFEFYISVPVNNELCYSPEDWI